MWEFLDVDGPGMRNQRGDEFVGVVVERLGYLTDGEASLDLMPLVAECPHDLVALNREGTDAGIPVTDEMNPMGFGVEAQEFGEPVDELSIDFDMTLGIVRGSNGACS